MSCLIAWALIVTVIGALVGIPMLIVLTLARVPHARGWLRLLDPKAM